MKEVTVKKDEFISKVTANRQSHIELFEKALAGYKVAVEAALLEKIEQVRNDDPHFSRIIQDERPENHSDDYDRVLTMAEMSVDDTITLSASDFARYVMDQWEWKEKWFNNASSYTAS
jgi:hypothetical protein